MPTPFYHLVVARKLLQRQELSSQVVQLLRKNAGAYMLGNTAPDVQTISGQARQATHFFELPVTPDMRDPWEQMFAEYPALRRLNRMDPGRAAFIAGYASHLLADWTWVKKIFNPYFGHDCRWGSLSERLYYHNVLRSYLDYQILPELTRYSPPEYAMEEVQPRNWLPFVQDAHMEAWRDYLCEQLKPGAAMKTVEVFASRQGIPAEDYYRLLNSEDRMQQEVFSHVSYQTLLDYQQALVDQNVLLLNQLNSARVQGSVWMPLHPG